MALVTQFQNILDLETEVRHRGPCSHSKSEVGGQSEIMIGAEQTSFRREVNHNTPVSSRPKQWVCAGAGLRPQVRTCRSMSGKSGLTVFKPDSQHKLRQLLLSFK